MPPWKPAASQSSKPFSALCRSTSATPIWENPSSRAHPRSRCSKRLPVDLMLTAHAPILETRTLHWPDEAACAAFAAHAGAAPGTRRRLHRTARPAGRRQDHLRATPAARARRGRPHQEPHLSPCSSPMRCRGWRSSTSTSTASTTRANGPTPASARSSRPRASSSPSGPRRPPGCCRVPDLRLSIEPIDDDLRQVRAEAGTPRGVELLR